VHALSRDESVVLARELPNLRNLMHTNPSPLRQSAAAIEDDRATVRRVLHLVQGHPKLLELADAAAVDSQKLATHLAAARTAAEQHGSALAAFFTQGASSLDVGGFLDVLTAWTASAQKTLPDDARLLLQMLCLLEDDDRSSVVVDGNWADLWLRLNRPGDPPDPASVLERLAAAALIHNVGDEELRWYRIHPGIAEAVRANAPAELRTAVDTELARWWYSVARRAVRESAGHSMTLIHAGLAAAPYLLRLQDWDTAGALLQGAVGSDRTLATAQVALPFLQRIASVTGELRWSGVVAFALERIDPAEAERRLHDILDQAVAAHDFQTAFLASSDLANLMQVTGRLQDALAMSELVTEYARRAGRDPSTILSLNGNRLQILNLLGHTEQVLAEVEALRKRLLDSHVPGPAGATSTWSNREAILNAGVAAATSLGRWQQALELNTEVLNDQQHRDASPHDIAVTRHNFCASLIGLGCLEEAESVLDECQQVFEAFEDASSLSQVLANRAILASKRGHAADAVSFGKSALRLMYARPDPSAVATAHYNQTVHLARGGTDAGGQVAHWLAAALIRILIASPRNRDTFVQALAHHVRTLRSEAPLPASVAELATQVEQVEGVHFTTLIRTLAPDPQTAEAALTDIIHTARSLSDESTPDLQHRLDRWEPHITALVAAAGGDQRAGAAIDQLLDQLAGTDGWDNLASILRRILAGERDPDTLLTGLDPVDSAIVQATLDRLATVADPTGDPS
jgi:tetratricopeptide (TPR) repeat protein